jgi:hypothetical protein
MRGKLGRHAAVAIFVILMLTGLSAWAIDEEKLISSAEKIVEAWQTMLDKGMDLVSLTRDSTYWKVMSYKIVGPIGYDIKKTDSIVTPYQLILTFNATVFSNATGPNRNGYYSKSLKEWYGFKTMEEALAHKSPADFSVYSDGMDFRMYYAFQRNAWVLKGGNTQFEAHINSHIRDKGNIHYFQDLLLVPVQ